MSKSSISNTKLLILDGIRILKKKYILIVLFCLISLITTFVLCSLQPPLYQAVSRITVTPKRRSFNVSQIKYYSPEYVQYFYFTQYIIMHSNKIYQHVVDQLDLRKRLSPYPTRPLPPEIALNWLRQMITINFSEKTNIIDIVVSSYNKVLATEIANAFVESYKNQQLISYRIQIDRTLRDLKAQLRLAKEKMVKSEEALEKIKKEHNLTFVRGYNIDKNKLREFNKDYLATRIDRVSKEVRFNMVKELSEEAQANLIALEWEYKNLVDLKLKLAKEEIRFASLQQDYGPEHPDIVETKAKIQELEKKVKAEVQGILHGLEIEYQVVKKRENELLSILNDAKKEIFELESTELAYLQAEREMQSNQEMYIMLQSEYIKQMSLYQLPEQTVEVVSKATPPHDDQYVSPNYFRSMVASGFTSFCMGILCVLLYGFLEKYVYKQARTRAFSVMTIVPTGVELVDRNSPEAVQYESFRILATKLLTLNRKNGLQSLFVTSEGAGEGKTTVAVNLALVLGEMGRRVLLVDYNLRKPDIASFLKINEPDIGLWNIQEHKKNYKQLIIPRVLPNVDFLPAGKSAGDIDTLLTQDMMTFLFTQIKRDYDMIVFDGPPIIGFGDALLLAGNVDGVAMVVGYHMFAHYSAEILDEYLRISQGKLIGTILNNVISGDETYKYYYQVLEAK